MYQQFPQPSATAPALSLLFGEARVFKDWARGIRQSADIAAGHDGEGHPVVLLPGFMVDDARMELLRRTLNAANYRAFGWGLGRNLGVTADMLQRLDAQLDQIGGKVTLIGWSLGGLIAREYAKHAPHRVARVVTMGSPFSGDIRANHAWRLYEYVAKHPVDAPPIAVSLAQKPPVPTYALWSRTDGIVAQASACGATGEVDEAIEVECGHFGFACAPEALGAVLGLLGRTRAA